MTKYIEKQRQAFSMITALFVIILLSTVAAFVLNLSAKIVDETTTQYRKEQAILYAKSYTEFAIMAATTRDCVKTITANVDGTATEVKEGQGYRVTVNLRYIGNELASGTCDTLGSSITHNPSIGSSVLIDTYVRYRNPDHPRAIAGDPWKSTANPAGYAGITYHRRTLQRL